MTNPNTDTRCKNKFYKENTPDTVILDAENRMVTFRRRYKISVDVGTCAQLVYCARAFNPTCVYFTILFFCVQRRRNIKCAQGKVHVSPSLKIKAFDVKECRTLKRLITASDATHPEWWSLAAQR
jgi:hypothetical protein